MWKLTFIGIGVIISALLSYLPNLGRDTHFIPQYTQLQLEINHSETRYLDRTQPATALISHSQHIYYDEAEQSTQLQPFSFSAIKGEQHFAGSSQLANIHQDIIALSHNVQVQQLENDKLSQLKSEQLIIDTQHHLLFSPEKVQLNREKQSTIGNQLIGNYQGGSYEFTHVQSRWE